MMMVVGFSVIHSNQSHCLLYSNSRNHYYFTHLLIEESWGIKITTMDQNWRGSENGQSGGKLIKNGQNIPFYRFSSPHAISLSSHSVPVLLNQCSIAWISKRSRWDWSWCAAGIMRRSDDLISFPPPSTPPKPNPIPPQCPMI